MLQDCDMNSNKRKFLITVYKSYELVWVLYLLWVRAWLKDNREDKGTHLSELVGEFVDVA